MPSTTPRLPRAVVVIGVVSLLNDFASEMVVPLIPLLLATVLAAGPVALGLIEGVAETVANLLKLWAGRRSDLYGQRRKPLVVGGYLLSNVVRPLIALANHWGLVLGVRVTDRVGKGLRTAPRDALIADLTNDGNAGRAYGLTRALDHGGAVLGALAAAAIVHWGTERLDIVIALSAVPGVLAVALFAFGVREPAHAPGPPGQPAPLRWSALRTDSRRYLQVLGLFALGRIPETFVLLRGHELGLGVVELLLLWATLHTAKSLISEVAGRLADRIGRRPVITAGWLLYALTMAGLALATTPLALWLMMAGLAAYYGLSEAAERALVRDLSVAQERGTAFGWYHMLTGLAAIPAGAGLGLVWAAWNAAAAFWVSAAITVLATLLFRLRVSVSRV